MSTPDVHVVIAGTGTYESELVAQASALIEAERITFTGWLPAAELLGLQAAADVIVVPSLYEPFGLVALEAGALGVPVVVADTGGLGDIVDHGRVGFIFPAGDSVALAHELDRALGDVPGRAHRLAKLRTRIETNYQWDRIAEATTTTYLRAEQERRTDPRPTEVATPVIAAANLLATD